MLAAIVILSVLTGALITAVLSWMYALSESERLLRLVKEQTRKASDFASESLSFRLEWYRATRLLARLLWTDKEGGEALEDFGMAESGLWPKQTVIRHAIRECEKSRLSRDDFIGADLREPRRC